MKIGQNFCLNDISEEVKVGHIGSKTRSLCQILDKPCVRSRGHSFSPILGQNICLGDFSDETENWSDQKIDHIVRC